MLLSLAVFTDDDGVVGLCCFCQTASQSKNFQGGQLRTVVSQNIAAGSIDRPENVNNASVRDGDNISRLQRDVVLGVARLHQIVQIDGDGVGQRRWLRLRRG